MESLCISASLVACRQAVLSITTPRKPRTSTIHQEQTASSGAGRDPCLQYQSVQYVAGCSQNFRQTATRPLA